MIDKNKICDTAPLLATDASQALFSLLRHKIESGALVSGDKIAPVRDLAKSYNLSFDAVRKVNKRLENAGFVSSKRGSGTYVNNHRTHNTDNALITDSVLMMMDAYGHVYRNISESLIGNLQNGGFSCVKYANDPMNWKKIPENVIKSLVKWEKHPPKAIVVNWVDRELFKVLNVLHASGSRIIALFGDPFSRPRWDYVGPNTKILASLASKYLINKGHQRIGFVTHRRIISNNEPQTHRKRTMGHTAIIIDLGHQLRKLLNKKETLTILYNTPSNNTPGSDPLTTENIKRAAKWLSQPHRPTAVIGYDFRLVGIIKAAEQIGLRIPEDLEILGIGNTPWSKAYDFKSISLNEHIIAQRITDIIALPLCSESETIHRILVAPSLDSDNSNN